MTAPCPTLGFVVTVRMMRGSIMSLLNELVPLLEAHGLTVHARGRDGNALQITREGTPAAEADRQIVSHWADAWSDRAQITVSGIYDLSESR